jgi:hypothetical protein
LLSGAAFAQVSSQLPNVAGNWIMSIPGKNQTMTYTLIQKGHVLTGILRGDRGNLPLKGTITNDRKGAFTGTAMIATLRFTGLVEGNTMKVLSSSRWVKDDKTGL